MFDFLILNLVEGLRFRGLHELKNDHLTSFTLSKALHTGKKRLSGFEGEWVVKKLGEVLTIAHGRSQYEVEVEGWPYPILGTEGKMGTANHFLFDTLSVLIGRKGTVGTLFYSIIHAPNDAESLYYRFLLINWKQHNEKSGVPSLNARTIEGIEIEVSSNEEQIAIAQIFRSGKLIPDNLHIFTDLVIVE